MIKSSARKISFQRKLKFAKDTNRIVVESGTAAKGRDTNIVESSIYLA